MNFINKLNKIALLFLGYLLLVYTPANAKGIANANFNTPIVQNFYFPNYQLSDNYSITADSNKIIYIGSSNKIIAFLGSDFLYYKIQGSIKLIKYKNTVFYQTNRSIGVIETKISPFKLHTHTITITKALIKELFVCNNNLFYYTNNKVYIYKNNRFEQIFESNKDIRLFVTGNILYLFETGCKKFWKYNKTFSLLAKNINMSDFNFHSYFINSTIETDFSNNVFSKMPVNIKNALAHINVTQVKNISNNKYALITDGWGFLLYNNNLKSIEVINQRNGLIDDRPLALYTDVDNNLWTVHNTGISRIHTNLPVASFIPDINFSGYLYNFSVSSNYLHLLTSDGLYTASVKNSNILGLGQLIFNKKTASRRFFSFFEFELKKYALGEDGVYEINNNSTKKIFDISINDAIRTKNINELLLVNSYGLHIISFNNGKISIKSSNYFLGLAITAVECDSTGYYWLKVKPDGLVRINSDSIMYYNPRVKYFPVNNFKINSTDEIKYIKPFKTPKFKIRNQVWEYKVQGTAYNFIETGTVYNSKIIQNWCNFSNIGICNYSKLLDEVFAIQNNANSRYTFQNMPQYLAGNYYPSINFYTDSVNNLLWASCNNALLKIYGNKLPKIQPDKTIVLKITSLSDSVFSDSTLLKLDYKQNAIKIFLSSTFYLPLNSNVYEYKLTGTESNWTKVFDNVIVLNNLKYGKYNFIARAISPDGTTALPVRYTFYIKAPYYLSWYAIIFYIIFFTIIIIVIIKWQAWFKIRRKQLFEQIIHERTDEIVKEKEKSDMIIANLLPKVTADELKNTGKVLSQKFIMATVLFSDIQGFTRIAEQMNPETLIDQLDSFFFHFDSVVEKYNIEKIKTIGDAYMCAGGIPNKNVTNPIEVVLAALEMLEYMRDLKARDGVIWDVRIGIHTGPLIAGVVGHKKMSYDIWGDSVNVASRMESSGEAGKINISEQTYEHVKDFFICEYRGKMPVKYKGEIDMYFVKGLRPELSINMRHIPNKKFFIMLQLIRLQDLEEETLSRLSLELPHNLYFHNIKKVKDTYLFIELLARAEDLGDEEKLMVLTAALMHEVGYIWNYDDHEEKSIAYAREILPRYNYSEEQIIKVCELIDVTRNTRKPSSKLEEIIIDADNHYLSRVDYMQLSENLFSELFERGKVKSHEEWVQMQIVLLTNHKYYTYTANKLRDISSDEQILNILKYNKI